MVTYSGKFLCRVSTLHGQALSAEATSVIFPASDGLAGVLAGCGPIAAALGAGPLTVVKAEGETLKYFVAGGFAHVRDDVVTILADECQPAGQLSEQIAGRQLEEARAMASRPAVSEEDREWTITVARARLHLARNPV